MSFKSKLKVENVGMFLASIFYTVVGITCFAVLAVIDFRFVHIGIIGILSLITAYGLFKSRIWTLWIAVALFFIATTFSGYMLYSAFEKNLLLTLIMISYFLLTCVFTAYTVAKRKS